MKHVNTLTCLLLGLGLSGVALAQEEPVRMADEEVHVAPPTPELVVVISRLTPSADSEEEMKQAMAPRIAPTLERAPF